jgi:molecular chaperone DnaK
LDNGERKIGDAAKRQAVTNSKKTVYSIKRLMGEKYDTVKKDIDTFSYDVIKDKEYPKIKIDDKKYSPQEISAMILGKMKKTAEDYLGITVDSAVITVPAYFNNQQREATKQAGEIVGLKVERIINEPTAAALAYGLDKSKKDLKVAVFDLGGGTYDISILEMGDGVFEVKSTGGDTHLGGDNFDDKIVDWIISEFKKDKNIDLRKDPMAYQRIREAAEKAKIELSSSAETEINLPYIIPVDGIPQHINTKLTRSKFEQLTDDLLNKIKEPCINTLKESGFSKEEIDEVLLVGGSTRIPIVQTIVKDIFGKEPSKNINPDEAVAAGAAIQGAILNGSISDVLLLDVTPLNLGIETLGGVMTTLVESNTTIPVSKSQIFSTAMDQQPSVEINVCQGNRPMARDNKSLGRFYLDNIPPAPRGIPQIEVKFDINSNGILEVSALDKGTGKSQSIRIEGSSSLTNEEIERMKKEAKENEEIDRKAKERVDKLNMADNMIFQTEKQIKEFDDKLNEEDKNNLNDALNKLKESHKSENIESIDKDLENLNSVWGVISTKLYQQTTQQTNEQDANINNESKSEQNVEDVNFEEIVNKE